MNFNIYDFTGFVISINNWLQSNFSPEVAQIVGMVIIGTCFLLFVTLLGLSLVYIERKICALFQQRLGPMRVGFWGTAQTLADIIKLVFKESLVTKNSDKFLFNLA